MNILAFLKDFGGWLVVFITGIFSLYLLVRNEKNKVKELNNKIFENELKSTYYDLFESKKDIIISRSESNLFNYSEIVSFCKRTVKFYDKGNRFKGPKPQRKFKQLYLVAKEIVAYNKPKHIVTEFKIETYDITIISNVEKLKKRYVDFCLVIKDVI